jgi:hypothetical protein
MTVNPTIRGDRPKVSTRELRALKLFEEHGHEIVQVAPDVYRVPSQDGERSYDVLYGEREECACPDHQYRGVSCVHLLAVGIAHAKKRFTTVRTVTVAGDPFAAAARCHCYNGVVYIGHMAEDPGTGEEAEVLEPVPCRRCQRSYGNSR